MTYDKPEVISLCLVDGDVVAYMASWVAQKENLSFKEACRVADEILSNIVSKTVVFSDSNNFKVFITGKSNFRKGLIEDYKGNRPKEKPPLLSDVRQYLKDRWDADESVNCEADDLIGIAHTKHNSMDTTVIASNDKDYKTLGGWMYNFKNNSWIYTSKVDALRFFYTQCLTGDMVDNIRGIKGVGPKTAEKILEGLTTEKELFEAVLKAYIERGYFTKDLLINGRLLHLQRYRDQVWDFPKCT